jgi:exopolyphosphatase/pppGpp-phosphohydrolase
MSFEALEDLFASLARQGRYDEMYARHSRNVAARAMVLFNQAPNAHGLAFDQGELVCAAGLLHDIEALRGKAEHHQRGRETILQLDGLGFSDEQRRILADAVALHSKRSDWREYLANGPADVSRRLRILAGRVGAILRIADALDHTRDGQTTVVATLDDGADVHLWLSSNSATRENAPLARHKSDLWNAVCPRPIGFIREWPDGESY